MLLKKEIIRRWKLLIEGEILIQVFFLVLSYCSNLVNLVEQFFLPSRWLGWSFWFAINAKKGDCWDLIQKITTVRDYWKREIFEVENVFQSFFCYWCQTYYFFGKTIAYKIHVLSLSWLMKMIWSIRCNNIT